MLHVNKVIPAYIQTLAVSTLSVQSVLQSIGAGVYERARSCSECSDVSELVFERALYEP